MRIFLPFLLFVCPLFLWGQGTPPMPPDQRQPVESVQQGTPPVSHERVIEVFTENNERLRELLFAVIPKIGPQPADVCATALDGARL